MRISTRTRYGLRLMTELGLRAGDEAPVDMKDIARRQEISEKYLSQIILPLKGRGLVNAFRGAHGGYVLGRAAEKIRLGEIVAALEGDLSLLECADEPASCKRHRRCSARDVWCGLGKHIKTYLDSYTLADLVRMQEKKGSEDALNYCI